MTEMFEYVNQRNGQYAPLIADDVQSNSRKCGVLDSHIIYNRILTTIILDSKH
jgi:ribonucleoside-diphosphate reductase alpha chain